MTTIRADKVQVDDLIAITGSTAHAVLSVAQEAGFVTIRYRCSVFPLSHGRKLLWRDGVAVLSVQAQAPIIKIGRLNIGPMPLVYEVD